MLVCEGLRVNTNYRRGCCLMAIAAAATCSYVCVGHPIYLRVEFGKACTHAFLTFNLCMRQSGVDARLGDRNVCVVCLFADMCWRGLQTMVHSRLLARRAVWHTHISLGTRCCKDSVLKQFAGDITMGCSAACETYSRLRARHVKYHIARTTCYTHVVTTSACLTSGRRLL